MTVCERTTLASETEPADLSVRFIPEIAPLPEQLLGSGVGRRRCRFRRLTSRSGQRCQVAPGDRWTVGGPRNQRKTSRIACDRSVVASVRKP